MSKIWLYVHKNTSAFGGLHPQTLYQDFALGAHCGTSIPNFQRLLSLNPRSTLCRSEYKSHCVRDGYSLKKNGFCARFSIFIYTFRAFAQN